MILFAAVLFVLSALSLATEKPSIPTGEIILRSMITALTAAVVATLLVAFVRWLWCWRNFRRFLFGLACLATLIALFYAEENIRGELAWNRCVEEQTASGEILDLLQLAPPPIPDEQNFFETSLWKPMHFTKTNGHHVWAGTNWASTKFDISGPARSTGEFPPPKWHIGNLIDLAELQAFYRGSNNLYASSEGTFTNYFPVSPEQQSPAEDVLFALSQIDDNRQLLIQASSRPKARFWINYEDGFAALLPHVASMKSIVSYLSLHSIAASQAGDATTALQDVMLSLKVMESVRNEPIVISHLVRIAILEITMQAIWEGLAASCWTDQQLAAIEAGLEQLDFVADYRFAVRGERAFQLWTIDYVEKDRAEGAEEVLSMVGPASKPDTLKDLVTFILFRLAPEGWFHQSKLATCETFSKDLLPVASKETRTIEPEIAEQALKELARRPTPFNLPARLVMPSMTKAAVKFAIAQSTADLSRVAVALERYRLATGSFPESLDSLAPKFIETIPHDVINGKPLNYRRASNGQYVLYSVGWNETDNGGEVALTSSGNTIDRNEGDWVWQLPDPKLQPY